MYNQIRMKQILKNKKAILMPEVLRLVIGVLCIILLIMLAVQLYSIFTRSNALEQAKATLNEIELRVNGFEKLGDSANMLILSPKNWAIVGFEDQLCICELDSNKKLIKNECLLKGACKKIKTNIFYYCGLGDPSNMIPNCIFMSQQESGGSKKLPFQLFLTKGYQETILSLEPYASASSGSLTRGFFTSYLDSINDVKLNNSVSAYVVNPTAENKQVIINFINSRDIIGAATKEGYKWQLQIKSSDGSSVNEIIYSDNSAAGCSTTDYHFLNGVDMGPSFKQTKKDFINLGIYLCK